MFAFKSQARRFSIIGLGILAVFAADQLGVFNWPLLKHNPAIVGGILLTGCMLIIIEFGRWLFSFGHKVVISIVGSALLGIFAAYRLDVFTDACWGTGSNYQIDLQKTVLRQILHEPLPEDFELSAFACAGFQDTAIDATLHLSQANGYAFLEDLEDTYTRDHNHHLFPDGQKTKHATGYPDKIVTKFELPANRIVYARTITVEQPRNDHEMWQIGIHGYTW